MSISTANGFERSGCLIEAINENLRILSAGENEQVAKMAKSNIERIFAKLSSEEKANFEHLLKRIKLQSDELADFKYMFQPSKDLCDLPLVSIVVPCFNCKDYLPKTLESLAAQTYSNFEVILVDDFSKDATPEICKDIAKRDRRFRFYQHRANGGLAASRNSGTRLSKGVYICYLDSDDLLAPESIEQRVNFLNKHAEFEVVAGVYDQSITIDNDYSGFVESVETKPSRLYVDFITAFGDCPFNANQPMLKKNVVISLGGFPERYPQAEDWRLWSKLFRAGYVFLPVNRVGSGYRQTTNSMIRRAPLLHVEKSKGNYFRSFFPVSEERDELEIRYETSFYSAPVFDESVGVYSGRHKFISRVFNFVGIEYARRESLGEPFDLDYVVGYFKEIEPDLSLVFAGYSIKNAVNWMLNGYKRFFGIRDVGAEVGENLNRFVTSVLNKIFSVGGSLLLGDASLLVPHRRFSFRESEYVDFVFFPHKKYHTQSFYLLVDQLRKKGLTFKFVDITVPYREEYSKIDGLDDWFISYNEFVFSRILPRVIVCMNDWDTVVKPLVAKANSHSIPTVGIVEGVQDYLDLDTGRKRNPYRMVSNVFLTGDFDRRYFSGSSQNLYSVGVQRLDGLSAYKELRNKLNSSGRGVPIVVLNVNFSYGVMTDRRAEWIKDVELACQKVGYQLVISQHPQDDADLSGYNVSKEPLYDLLVKASFFVSRFSGAILESLVIGCPVVYFNSHQEKVDKFFDSQGAYRIANSRDELVSIFQDGSWQGDSTRFLENHACYGTKSIVDSTIDALENVLKTSPSNKECYLNFKRALLF